MTRTAAILNALWLLAIAFALGFGSVPGLLAIIALFLMDGVLELKAIRRSTRVVAEVFEIEPDPLVATRADAIADGVMTRIRADVRAAASRRVH